MLKIMESIGRWHKRFHYSTENCVKYYLQVFSLILGGLTLQNNNNIMRKLEFRPKILSGTSDYCNSQWKVSQEVLSMNCVWMGYGCDSTNLYSMTYVAS